MSKTFLNRRITDYMTWFSSTPNDIPSTFREHAFKYVGILEVEFIIT